MDKACIFSHITHAPTLFVICIDFVLVAGSDL